MKTTNEQAGSRQGVGKLVGLLGLVLAVVLVVWLVCRRDADPQTTTDGVPGKTTAVTVDALVDERNRLDATVWEKEVLAQRYEDFFVALWDKLRAANDKLSVLADVPFDRITLGVPLQSTIRDSEIRDTRYGGAGRSLSPEEWRRLLEDARQNKLQIVQTEWHHSRFEAPSKGEAKSTINLLIHAVNVENQKRYDVSGTLDVVWSKLESDRVVPKPRLIDARNVRVIERSHPVPFEEVWTLTAKDLGPVDLSVAPTVLVYDLDRDGLSDLVLPSWNLLYHNLGGWKFEKRKLLANPWQDTIMTGVLGDFTGDGRVDLLCVGRSGDRRRYPVCLYQGDKNGNFSSPLTIIDCVGDAVNEPSVLTAGDVDLDGDLDVWLAQYKPPYVLGQMPTPYFDANDGFSAFLLLNDGGGRFQDATVASGLGAKRHRRTYSGSLVDLDEDGDLDLVTVSDFAGLDLYLNDGLGIFQDATETHVDHRHAFGMAHTFADYNNDGKLDFYMIGMSSTTARRLEQLGLGRPDFPKHQQKRSEMGYGNRMYLASKNGFRQASFNGDVARSGWSWGATSFDFDNDGDPDVYVANGHKSGTTAKDYCTKYWCHDIYTGTSEYNPKIEQFFDLVNQPEMASLSWNGFEHNCLFMNESGRGFLRVDFLMGVALEADSRNVVSDDFDNDGRRDLLVVTYSRRDGNVIHLYRNKWQSDHHWIGVRIHEAPGHSPLGTRITVRYAGGQQTSTIVAGDSYHSQHSTTAHFGLADVDGVDSIDIRWPGGKQVRIMDPAVDRYHTIRQ
jgi:hypothetical protein